MRVRVTASVCVFSRSFCEFWWLHTQFKYHVLVCVYNTGCTTLLYVHLQKCVYVCVCGCNVLCFTSNCCLPLSSLCPALPRPHGDTSGSGNMGRGTQGGRTPQLERNSNEPAQSHSYSHDNRPQTNSCIWSPLVLWLWKHCMCLCRSVCGCFCFRRSVSVCCTYCACTQASTSTFLLRNWPGSWFTLMSTQDVIIVCYDHRLPFLKFQSHIGAPPPFCEEM